MLRSEPYLAMPRDERPNTRAIEEAHGSPSSSRRWTWSGPTGTPCAGRASRRGPDCRATHGMYNRRRAQSGLNASAHVSPHRPLARGPPVARWPRIPRSRRWCGHRVPVDGEPKGELARSTIPRRGRHRDDRVRPCRVDDSPVRAVDVRLEPTTFDVLSERAPGFRVSPSSTTTLDACLRHEVEAHGALVRDERADVGRRRAASWSRTACACAPAAPTLR